MKTVLFLCLLVISLHASAQRTIKKDQMKLSLSGLFISGHTLSFDMLLFNRSLLGFEPQYVKFFIRERKIAARTAVQEKEVHPLDPLKASEILADSSQQIILNFYQFTIPNTKELVISVKEKNGTRDLALHIPGNRLLRMIRVKKDMDK